MTSSPPIRAAEHNIGARAAEHLVGARAAEHLGGPITLLPPPPLPRGRTPAQKAGYRYERRVGKVLAAQAASLGWALWDHVWIGNDEIVRQPDFVLISPSGAALVAEAKLTWVDTRAQLEEYCTLLARMELAPVPFSICRNLTPESPDIVLDFDSIYSYSVWHLWL